jgi:4-diphosphocytidyl-2-C-methyl-D-erythritol kinase
MKIRSTAKINLYLDVTGRDPADGYHYVDSLFQEIGLADEIEIAVNHTGADEVVFIPDGTVTGNDSTVHRALEGFRKKTGIGDHFTVRVNKNIPVGAGLGGGSSNAAFVLMALGKKYRVPVSVLAEVGQGIGSDVPFFFTGGLCRVSGKGEKIEKWPGRLKKVHFLVVYPNIPISTKWAYSLITDYGTTNKVDIWSKKRVFDIDFLKKITYNKFEHFVIRSLVKLGESKTKLDQTLNHDLSFMSGSGSSLVYAYESKSKAKKDLRLVLDRFNFRCFLSDPFYR